MVFLLLFDLLYMCVFLVYYFFFFFKQKTAYEMRISDWSSDVCSSDLTDSARKNAPVRATPIVLLPREFAGCWQSAPDIEPELSGPANDVLVALRENGASFFVDLVADTNRDRKSVVLGKSVSRRVDIGGRRLIKKQNTMYNTSSITK